MDLAELPEEICIIEVEDEMVGYGVVWEYDNGGSSEGRTRLF